MARIKLVYVGGGSSRAAGTMASFIQHGEEFNGSEVVLVDLDPDRLSIVRTIAEKLVAEHGVDLTITATTDRRAGLTDADAVLTSFRAGDFAARALDERIPVKHGVIGQETQGPGGMFMAMRSLHVIKDIVAEIEQVAPRATIFNYTNPVNIVSQAVSDFSEVPIYSMCEGPVVFPPYVLRAAGLDPDRANVVMAGLNHNCWSFEHTYDGQDLIPLLRDAWEARRDDPTLSAYERRLLHLAVVAESVPADYFNYYYFRDEVLREQQAAPRTRAEVILDALPGYWQHYTEQAQAPVPTLDPGRSRGGIHELELAIDVMSAHFNDTGARLPVNLPNTGGALPGFSDDTVVEMWCTVDAAGIHPVPQRPLPPIALALTQHLAEYQKLAAYAAWQGTRADGVRAMLANPLVPSLSAAEALYDELALAHARYLPERLLS
ncbi:glycoside hydrolase [Dactylosporangium sp. CA-233914]|uniref:family 4 glycosyl hydrolase n=1 Tax=Dactylosporangium sp. CA-233914 TaxID=3239934 RepID=UPI003D8DACE7